VAHGDDLLRKPLAEAIFELRWKLSGTPPAPLVDPTYKLLVGSLFGAVRDEYPYHEQLPTAAVPDEMVPYLIQHRFRRAEAGYPLVQVGPGVFAVNETSGYSWSTYRPRVLGAVAKLRETYAAGSPPNALVPVALTLRYINVLPFDLTTGDVFAYMRDKLRVSIAYPQGLFAEQPVAGSPTTIILQSTHALTSPAGVVLLKFSAGDVNGESRLLWETQVQSVDADIPDLDDLETWLERAHSVVRAWFFTLIEGELEGEFNS
jgi:uncharacterized protein (TIGR04255 family)